MMMMMMRTTTIRDKNHHHHHLRLLTSSCSDSTATASVTPIKSRFLRKLQCFKLCSRICRIIEVECCLLRQYQYWISVDSRVYIIGYLQSVGELAVLLSSSKPHWQLFILKGSSTLLNCLCTVKLHNIALLLDHCTDKPIGSQQLPNGSVSWCFTSFQRRAALQSVHLSGRGCTQKEESIPYILNTCDVDQ